MTSRAAVVVGGRAPRRKLTLATLLVLAGCGYHLQGTENVPAAAHTVSIELFGNRTHEHGLEVQLRRAIEDEFRRRGPLRVVPEGQGDVVLSGDIRSFTSVPVAFSATDEAVQYQGILNVAVRLTERESGRTLFKTPGLQESQDFGAVSGVVISSSPHFQRGTLNARDIANLTNVQLIEARRREALRELLDQVAHEVYEQAMGGF